MSYAHEVNRGHRVTLTIRGVSENTYITGFVSGVAESFGNPDDLRITIQGISEWFDLSQPDIRVEQVA